MINQVKGLKKLIIFVFVIGLLAGSGDCFAFTPKPGSPLALKQHPRLLVTDWGKLKNKIETDTEYKIMYKNLKNKVDTRFIKKIIIDRGREFEYILPVIFVGQVEKAKGNTDPKYKDKAVELFNTLYNREIPNSRFIKANHTSVWATHTAILTSLIYDWYYQDLDPATAKKFGEYLKGLADTFSITLMGFAHNKT